MDELNKRVLRVMEYSGESKSGFAQMLDISMPVLTHLSSGRNKPSLDIMIKIIENFPEISKDWLLLGKGEFTEAPQKKINVNNELSQLRQQVDALNNIISQLQNVVKYHQIFLNEVSYLNELSALVQKQQLNAQNVAKNIQELTNSINVKVED